MPSGKAGLLHASFACVDGQVIVPWHKMTLIYFDKNMPPTTSKMRRYQMSHMQLSLSSPCYLRTNVYVCNRLSKAMPAFSSMLEPWIPAKAPRQWFIINSVCCAWSLGLFLIVLFATDDSSEKQFAKAQYLVYNLITTVVWISEYWIDFRFHE